MKKNDLGIDISEHNGFIDFVKLTNQGIKYVIIRIGWIGNKNNHTIDKYFEEYYKKAKENGIPIGIYVYNYCKSIVALDSGCLWIEKNLKNKKIDLPIFLDMEDDSIRYLTKENLTDQCIYFCKFFEKRGYKSGIYANKYWFTNLIDINKILNYKIWLAEWNKISPSFNYKIDLWQYCNKGKFDGMLGNVDCNRVMCNCENNQQVVDNSVDKEDFEMIKEYKNGSTIEPVYADTNLTKHIGNLNPYEKCESLGIFKNRAMVRYKIDNQDNYKIGFVKWINGINKIG